VKDICFTPPDGHYHTGRVDLQSPAIIGLDYVHVTVSIAQIPKHHDTLP
jgi:hypothetical protein